MQSGVWVLLIWIAPCLPVALFGWRRASLMRTLAAEAWTVIASAITLVLVGFSALGDCAEDVIGRRALAQRKFQSQFACNATTALLSSYSQNT
jgi:hypothetical protein